MKRSFIVISHIFVFIILTLITQIGGVIYLLSIFIARKIKTVIYGKKTFLFLSIYFISTYLLVPPIAHFFGREKLQNTENVGPANNMTIFLNRNYVRKELNQILHKTSSDLSKWDKKIKINYLDANFPFYNGFPLLPHLSHNDGCKLDISFVYVNNTNTLSRKVKTRSGYGAFEGPLQNEENTTGKCILKGYYQYDYAKYLTFGSINKDLKLSEYHTSELLKLLLKHKNIEKIFIEPHLMKRMHLVDDRIRFQGCKSVRHDDHIHIQINSK